MRTLNRWITLFFYAIIASVVTPNALPWFALKIPTAQEANWGSLALSLIFASILVGILIRYVLKSKQLKATQVHR